MIADLGPVDGQLFVGAGVHHAADAFDLFGDLARRRAPLGALEQHVLEEVRDAGDLVALVARTRADEDADADRARVRQRAADDAQAVGQNGLLEHLSRWSVRDASARSATRCVSSAVTGAQPRERGPRRAASRRYRLFALVDAHARLVRALGPPAAASSARSTRSRSPGPPGRPRRARSSPARPATSTGTPRMSAWNCIKNALAGPPPSTFSSRAAGRVRLPSRRARSRDLIGDALQRGARDVRRGRAAREADDRPRAYMSQCGAPSPANAGTK